VESKASEKPAPTTTKKVETSDDDDESDDESESDDDDDSEEGALQDWGGDLVYRGIPDQADNVKNDRPLHMFTSICKKYKQMLTAI
jgi:hypothetical protein